MGATGMCVACGERVEAYTVDLGGVTEVRCLRCGLPLEARRTAQTPGFQRALVADDARFFREAVAEYLSSRRVAREVVTARDGAEALEKAIEALRGRRPLDLVILDLLMPRLNGLHAGVAIRAAERAFGARPAPVVFFSSRRIDASLKPLLEDLKPAYYVNKGPGTAELLGDRLAEVLRVVQQGFSLDLPGGRG
ncbi:response regulator [Deferrisoma sp.]